MNLTINKHIQLVILFFISWLSVSVVCHAQTGTSKDHKKLQEFVLIHYHHGLPAQQAREFGSAAIPELLRLLNDPVNKHAWPNIVYMLGLLEEPEASKALIDFLEKRFVGEVDDATYRALVVVPQSLALASRGQKGRAEEYLLDGFATKTWKKKDKIRWTYPLMNKDEQGLMLRKLSIEAAGSLGTDSARRALEKLKKDLPEENTRARAMLTPAVEQALELHERIHKSGRQILFERPLEWE